MCKSFVLYVLSLLFQLGCRLRHICYDKGIFSCFHAPCLVVSVGNVAVGGTGKTPFVQKLVRDLNMPSGSIAIVSRGYLSQLEGGGGHLVSQGYGPELSVELAGDEPFLLAKNTNASVFVGKKRFLSIEKACKQGARLIVLEDGFQHRRVFRDIDIVLLDAQDLWGQGYFLPRGLLRDFPSRLQKANWIIVTKVSKNCNLEKITKDIRQYTQAPIVGFGVKYYLDEGIKGKKIGAFCGLAKPCFFYEALQDLGQQIVRQKSLKDHRTFSINEIKLFAKSCKSLGAEALVCTEKDFVKLSFQSLAAVKEFLPIFVLKMEFVCVWNENVWQQIKQAVHTRCN